MNRIAAVALVLVPFVASCGVVKDPSPTDLDDEVRVRAGSSKTVEIVPDEEILVSWDEEDDDTGYFDWKEHVRGLPRGFDYDTLDVDVDDHELRLRYRISVEPWVKPGEYDFEVRFEFWPDDDIFREEFRIDINVTVKPALLTNPHVSCGSLRPAPSLRSSTTGRMQPRIAAERRPAASTPHSASVLNEDLSQETDRTTGRGRTSV